MPIRVPHIRIQALRNEELDLIPLRIGLRAFAAVAAPAPGQIDNTTSAMLNNTMRGVENLAAAAPVIDRMITEWAAGSENATRDTLAEEKLLLNKNIADGAALLGESGFLGLNQLAPVQTATRSNPATVPPTRFPRRD